MSVLETCCRDIKILYCVGRDAPYGGNGFAGITVNNSNGSTNFYDGFINWSTNYWNTYPHEPWNVGVAGNPTGSITWNVLIHGCTTHRNADGISLYPESIYGDFGLGIVVTHNIITANAFDGITVSNPDGLVIQNNTIRNNGWGFIVPGGYGPRYPADFRAPYFD
jgi:parallel beta-helix repeat protein